MSFITRRSFLLKVGVGLVAFIPATRALWKVADPLSAQPAIRTDHPSPPASHAPPSNQVDPRYASGNVLEVAPTALRIQTPYAGQRMLYLSESTLLWDDEWVKDLPVEVGEKVVAWGQPLGDGALATEKMWVNPENIMGPIRNIRGSFPSQTFELNDRRKGWMAVALNAKTQVSDIRGKKQDPAPGQEPAVYQVQPFDQIAVEFRDEQHLQVVGWRKNGSVQAVTLYLDS